MERVDYLDVRMCFLVLFVFLVTEKKSRFGCCCCCSCCFHSTFYSHSFGRSIVCYSSCFVCEYVCINFYNELYRVYQVFIYSTVCIKWQLRIVHNECYRLTGRVIYTVYYGVYLWCNIFKSHTDTNSIYAVRTHFNLKISFKNCSFNGCVYKFLYSI